MSQPVNYLLNRKFNQICNVETEKSGTDQYLGQLSNFYKTWTVQDKSWTMVTLSQRNRAPFSKNRSVDSHMIYCITYYRLGFIRSVIGNQWTARLFCMGRKSGDCSIINMYVHRILCLRASLYLYVTVYKLP